MSLLNDPDMWFICLCCVMQGYVSLTVDNESASTFVLEEAAAGFQYRNGAPQPSNSSFLAFEASSRSLSVIIVTGSEHPEARTLQILSLPSLLLEASLNLTVSQFEALGGSPAYAAAVAERLQLQREAVSIVMTPGQTPAPAPTGR